MIILLVGVLFFFGFSAVAFGLGTNSNPNLSQTVDNADERLVDDLLAQQAGETYLEQSCTDDYFQMVENTGCGITGFNTSAPNETHWLQHSLGVETEHQVNVSIVDGGSFHTNPAGDPYTLGEPVPERRDVYESVRYVSFDGSGYYIMYVRVW